MKNTQMGEKLKELEVNMHISRGEVLALRQARRNLEDLWLRAEMAYNLKEVKYSSLSREVDELEKENPE